MKLLPAGVYVTLGGGGTVGGWAGGGGGNVIALPAGVSSGGLI